MRMTRQEADGTWRIAKEYLAFEGTDAAGPAADKLAAKEDLCETLALEQEELSRQLAQLRAAGKTKTAHFRELMAKKLTNSQVVSLLYARGLTEQKDF